MRDSRRARGAGGCERDRLGPHHDGDGATDGAVAAAVARADSHASVGEPHERVRAVRALERPRQQRAVADEAGDERGMRVAIDVLWPADLVDAAAVHHHDPVGHRQRLGLIVRDVDERRPERTVDAAKLELHLLAQLQIEGRKRLVEQQHARPVHECACERDALRLPARELADAPARQFGEADRRQRFHRRARCGPRARLRPPAARTRRWLRRRGEGRARSSGTRG